MLKPIPGFVMALIGLVTLGAVWASEVEFTAEADRSQITLDESVSIKFTVKTEGSAQQLGAPNLTAPEFDLVNEYTSQYVESFYENGNFGVRNTQTLTRVLKPRKQGTFKITGLSIQAGSKIYTSPDLEITVEPGGAATQPPRGYGGAGVGLRGAGKRARSSPFFVRAEVDKTRAYKGEQIIVSYYLYRRARVFNIQAEKFPTFNGFLREELDMPILGQRLNEEQVILDGAQYARALVARYGAYPLQEGKLPLDAMEIKANYYSGNQREEDDPFFHFFQSITPQKHSSKSEPVAVEVLPLPTSGRPESFTGGVGEYSVIAAVNRYQLKTGEALSLTLKIEGRGNVAAIEEPKVAWPKGIEKYESKGHSKAGRTGTGEKIFEYLLIPRAVGKYTLPGIEVGFFDPKKAQYVTRTTEPITIDVAEGAPGSNEPQKPATPGAIGVADSLSTPGLKASPEEEGVIKVPEFIRTRSRGLVVLAGLVVFLVVGYFVGMRVLAAYQQKKAAYDPEAKRLAESKSWNRLKTKAATISRTDRTRVPWTEVTQAYELLCGAVYDAIDRQVGTSSRALSRMDLRAALVASHQFSEESWKRLERLLEFAEMVRYASSTGIVTEEQARSQLTHWVVEGQLIEEALRSPGLAIAPKKQL